MTLRAAFAAYLLRRKASLTADEGYCKEVAIDSHSYVETRRAPSRILTSEPVSEPGGLPHILIDRKHPHILGQRLHARQSKCVHIKTPSAGFRKISGHDPLVETATSIVSKPERSS